MKVDFWLNIGYGEGRKETIEYPDDVTDEELTIDQSYWAANFIDSGFYANRAEKGLSG
jgi:hypothetical protein